MPQLQHDYFGKLDTDDIEEIDVVWEDDVALAEDSVNVCLWAFAGETLQSAELDIFAKFLQEFTHFDRLARAALCANLQEDASYIDFHREEMEGGEALPKTVDAFVQAMTLERAGLWTTATLAEATAPIVLDYMIDADHSDEILAVKMNGQGEVIAIDWES